MTQPTYLTDSTQTARPGDDRGVAVSRRSTADINVGHRRIDRPADLANAADNALDDSHADFSDVAHDEIALAALQRLADSSVAELRFLRVDHQDNEIRLNGRVRSFYHKQLAQETVRPIAQGSRLVNEVKVD